MDHLGSCNSCFGSNVFLAFLPTIIAKTSLRDTVLNAIVDDPKWSISSQSASFGWLSGVAIDHVEVIDANKSTTLRIGRLTTEKSWLSLWLLARLFPSGGLCETVVYHGSGWLG